MTFNEKTGSVKFKRYGLTLDGFPICVDEFCLRMANNPHTSVILFQDWDSIQRIKEAQVIWGRNLTDLNIEDMTGLQSFCSYHAKPRTAIDS